MLTAILWGMIKKEMRTAYIEGGHYKTREHKTVSSSYSEEK